MSIKIKTIAASILMLVALVVLIKVALANGIGQDQHYGTSTIVMRELTEREKMAVFLYEQVEYDYKKFSTIKKVIDGESGWNPNAVGDSGKAKGVAQFHKPTFDDFSRLSGIEGSYEDPYDQIKLMIWAFNNNLESHWTVWRKLKMKGLV